MKKISQNCKKCGGKFEKWEKNNGRIFCEDCGIRVNPDCEKCGVNIIGKFSSRKKYCFKCKMEVKSLKRLSNKKVV